MTEPERQIAIPGVQNFRDLGGYPTADGRCLRWGALYRSAALGALTEAGAAALQNRRVTRVIDFRSAPEKANDPPARPDGWHPDELPIPLGGNAAAWIRDLMQRLGDGPFPADEMTTVFTRAYRGFVTDHTEEWGRFFEALLAVTDRRDATLFHCTAGKDRTGFAAVLLLSALGVDKATIEADFLLTNRAIDVATLAPQVAADLGARSGSTIDPRAVEPLLGVRTAFLETAYATINHEFGGMETYLTDALGLDADAREALKSRYLEA